MFKQKKHFGGSAKPKIAKLSHGILKILEVDVRDANKRDQMAMHKAVDLGHVSCAVEWTTVHPTFRMTFATMTRVGSSR